jgi:hypothetical protein
MPRTVWLLALLAVFIGLAPSHAAGLFGRKSKPNPAERVPVLLETLKSDPDERKRADAIDELRQQDLRAFPQIVPALIEALKHDASAGVRSAAADALGKVRPIDRTAGFALEQALANDKAMRVRMSARSALWQYYLYGYRGGRPVETGSNQSGEPPLATPPPARPTPSTPVKRVAPAQGDSAEPPLADPNKQSSAPAKKSGRLVGTSKSAAPASLAAKATPVKPVTPPAAAVAQSAEPPLAVTTPEPARPAAPTPPAPGKPRVESLVIPADDGPVLNVPR